MPYCPLHADVLLLADVFEEFRSVAIREYGLDPAHYVSSPSLAWDAMLKMTGAQLELISDAEMYGLIGGAIRGGVSQISRRFARANNPLLGDKYDPAKPTSYIIYWDVNNLYGWAMSQLMPVSNFEWLDAEEASAIDWATVDEEGEYGFFVVCDLEYPKELHDAHNDYPLAPEQLQVSFDMYSLEQVRLRSFYDIPKSAGNYKLIPNLMKKCNYCCHFANLKFYIKHGLQLVKVHRAIRFKQSKWLHPYVAKCTELRTKAKTPFEKDYHKLMVNSVYGKTCENQSKRSDIRLVTNKEQLDKLIQKPQLKQFRLFGAENLAGIELRKVQLKINKPFYAGFSVLELSKLCVFRFHYEYVLPKYGAERAKLLFTDTDSLMYWVETDNIYEDMWAERDRFDLASYGKESKYYDATNDKVIGKMKDETSGKPIYEFCGLRPKMYAFCFADGKDKFRAKGVARAAQRDLHYENFKRQLELPEENSLQNVRIGSKLHQTFTIQMQKRGLCAFDDKRFIMDDTITSLAYGHYRITHDVQQRPADGEAGGMVFGGHYQTKRQKRRNWAALGREAKRIRLTCSEPTNRSLPDLSSTSSVSATSEPPRYKSANEE